MKPDRAPPNRAHLFCSEISWRQDPSLASLPVFFSRHHLITRSRFAPLPLCSSRCRERREGQGLMKPGKRRQRRRLSSPSRDLPGVITRSRAENFLHRSRSGRARSDPIRRVFISSCDKSKLPKPSRGSGIGVVEEREDTSLSSIKDLRARRIFSPAAVPAESFEEVKEKIGGDHPAVVVAQSSRVEELELKSGLFDDNRGNANSERVAEVSGEVVDEKPVIIGGVGTISDEVKSEISMNGDSCGEGRLQTTPPDNELCRSEPEEVVQNVDMGESCLDVSGERKTATHVVIDSLELSIRGEYASTKEHRDDDSGKRLQLIPCPRRKLFRTSNSLGYRRLLPYLMGVSADSAFHVSGHSEYFSSKNESPVKVHKHKDENLQLSCSGYVAQGNGAASEIMSCPEHFSKRPKISLTENFAENEPIARFSSAVGLEGQGEKSDGSLLGNHVVNELGTISPHIHCDRSPPAVNQLTSTCTYNSDMEICTQSPSTRNNFQVVAIQDHQELSVLAPTKGILKTNPQRCRGFCNCLSCSQFRFHAEKSYDFCRKQMLDTEQIVMGLLKEMSHLRSVMEKRLEPTVQGASDSSLHLTQDKGICKRVHRAEDLARTRLRQMAQNVNIHCKIMRLQRPRVAFADQVEKLFFEG
ncbi:hypothetical protein H6P81_012152 [Aristolochia fimbriata]|uniref:Uncharacterized protein n=1 Tax=Aristolochia fimbriata TaxID=158543 RepID=A0AAV7EBJ5_ARIFI|nr:hypothetical protein H6P81_012152 [Aristolochia fimbriata]